MTDHSWQDLYDTACKLYGQTPRADDEQAILQVFMTNPTLVERQAAEVGKALHAGRVTWAWSALKARVTQSASHDVVVSDNGEREKRIIAAERWIRNAGVSFDREAELESELFGDTGRLREWGQYDHLTGTFTGDEVLRARMLDAWRSDRPRGVRAEAEAAGYAAKWKSDQARIRGKARAAAGAVGVAA